MTHEDFSRELPKRTTTDRIFGLTIAGVLTATGLLPLVRRHPVRWWELILAALLLAVSLAAPSVLGPVKRVWMRVAHMINLVVAHVLSALLLLIVFAPVRLWFRITGRDLLGLRWNHAADTYWVLREPPGPAPETMTHQF